MDEFERSCELSSLGESECDNYGSNYCKVCSLYFCSSHLCSHLISQDIPLVKDLGVALESEESYDKSDTDFYVLAFLPTDALRRKRDGLFELLKQVQKELDLRALSQPEYQDYTRYSPTRRTRNSTGRSIPKPKQTNAKLKQAIEMLKAKGLLEKFIKERL